MERVRGNIHINGRPAWTLYDTGSRNSYALSESVNGSPVITLRDPFRVRIGGGKYRLRKQAVISARIENKPVSFNAFIIDDLGNDEDGKKIQVLFGALDMRRFGIRPVPDKEKLDLSNYTRDFVEY